MTDFLFLGSIITADNDCRHEIRKTFASWQESYEKPRQTVEKQRHYSADKIPYSQGYSLPSGHVWLWELNHKEGGAPKNWSLWIVVLEKTPESPLDSKDIQPVKLKGNQPWTCIGRTDAEAETPVLWSSDVNSWLIGKVPDTGKDWGQKKRLSEDEIARGITDAIDMTLGKLWEMVRDREAWSAQSLACKESDTTGWLNNNRKRIL